MNMRQTCRLALPGMVSVLLLSEGLVTSSGQVYAQIVPDGTLGAESSIVTPDAFVRGDLADLIEGGATRGSALFHSFADFNVNAGQRVYFANPSGIDNILSRVTGLAPSQIEGLLGVNGGANLFFLNPNGIIFGPDAQLDVEGSFVASTSDRFQFADGSEFRATDPNAAPLVTVNIPLGLQLGEEAPAAIESEANLAAGSDLWLSASTVRSMGLLSAPNGQVRVEGLSGDVQVQAVEAQSALLTASENLVLEESRLITQGNLTLQADQTVRIRDSVETPFLAAAGGDLRIQGNAEVDILALNHLALTPFQSGGDLLLISDGIISGDAHFTSGGNFAFLDTAGNPGTFVSLYDPIISAAEDVTFGEYTGISLKVEAQGTITINGNITITDVDNSAAVTGSGDPDAPILANSAALILRAGLATLQNPPGEIGDISGFVDAGDPQLSADTGGSLRLGGNITAGNGVTNGRVILAATDGIVLDNAIAISSNNGDIDFESAIDGQGNDLTITAGTGEVTFAAAAGTAPGAALGTITINSSGNTTFAEALTAASVNIQDTDGTVAFAGNTNLSTGLITAAQPYNIAFTGTSNTVAGDTTFNHTGIVTLGDQASDSVTFTGGLDTRSSSNANLAGTIATNNQAIDLGLTAITNDVTINSNGGAVNLTADVNSAGGNHALTINSGGGSVTVSEDIGTANNGEFASVTLEGNNINLTNTAAIEVETGGSISIGENPVTNSVTSQAALTAPEGIIYILGNDIAITGNTSDLDVSGGNNGGVVVIDGTTVNIASVVTINAAEDPPNNPVTEGTVVVNYTNAAGSAVNIDQGAGITAETFIEASPFNPDSPTVDTGNGLISTFENFEIVDSSTPLNTNVAGDPIWSQLFQLQSIDPCQPVFSCPVVSSFTPLSPSTLLIPETIIEGTATSSYFGTTFFTGGTGFILEATNNFTVRDLVDNALTLSSSGGQASFVAGNIFAMNQGNTVGDVIQTNGRDFAVTGTTINIGNIGTNQSSNAGIDTRSLTIPNGLSGDLLLRADDTLTITNSLLRSDRTTTNLTDSFIQLSSTNGSVTLDRVSVNAGNEDLGKAGNVYIDAADIVTLRNQSNVTSDGRSGEIFLGSSFDAQGNFDATSPPQEIVIQDSQLSTEFDLITTDSTLQAGTLDIRAAEAVTITNSQVSSDTGVPDPDSTAAQSGGIRIQTGTTGSILVSGSQLTSGAAATATGSAGAIRLQNARTIAVENGSVIRTSSRSTNTASGSGVIELQTPNGTIRLDNSTLENTVIDGTGGDINLIAQAIAIESGAEINASTSGQGEAGSIAVTALGDANATTPDLVIRNSQIQAASSSTAITAGDAGAIALLAPDGGTILLTQGSTVSSSTTGAGNSRDIQVEAANLSVLEGSVLQARSDGTGAPGSIALEIADSLEISGTSPVGQISEVSTFSGENAELTASAIDCLSDSSQCVGTIRINTFDNPVNSLLLSDRGRINSQTQSANASGQGGSIEVFTNTLDIQSGGQITATSTGAAQAGSIRVVAFDQATIGGTAIALIDAFPNAVTVNTSGNVAFDVLPSGELNSALLSTSFGSLPTAVLENQLGLTNGTLNGLGNGAPIEGSGLQLVTSDGSLTFNWELLAFEELFGSIFCGFFFGACNPAQNDFAFADINGAPETIQTYNAGGLSSTGNETYALNAGTGQNLVSLGIADAVDNLDTSSLRISNLRLNGQPITVRVNSPDIAPDRPFISGIFAEATAIGDAGTIQVETPNLTLQDNGQVSGATVSGTGNNLTISGLNGGSLNQLNVDGGLISASTVSGTAGSVSVNANQVNLRGTVTNPVTGQTQAAGILAEATSTNPADPGTAGSVTVTANQLTVEDGGAIATSAQGSGRAGNVNVAANTITVTGTDSIIGASTEDGIAGTVDLQAANLLQVTVAGRIETSAIAGTAGDININAGPVVVTGSNSAISATAESGRAGNITLTTPRLRILDGGAVSVSSNPQGAAGGLTVTTDQLLLDRGRLTAETGTAGDANSARIVIDLDNDSVLENILWLRNESLISATASGNATGGNIQIDTDFIIAENPTGNEGSDIVANADAGAGGNITINALAAFGIQVRPAQTPLNDITASSESGVQGTVTLNTLTADPSSGLADLAFAFVDASDQTQNQCTFDAGGEASEITVAGRGGLPAMPTNPLGAATTADSDWVTLAPATAATRSAMGTPMAEATPPTRGEQRQALCHRAYQQTLQTVP